MSASWRSCWGERRARRALLLTVAWLAACSSEPALNPLPRDATVVAFGDSLTSGSGVARQASYPAVLGRLTGLEVINAGVPGELSAAGRRRLPAVLERHRPDLLILCHGGNDLLRRRPAAAIKADIQAMIETTRRHGAQVLLVAVPEPGLRLETAPLYGQVAHQMGVALEGDVVARVEGDPALKADRIHPNAQGHRHIAQAIATRLRRAGALAD